MKILYITTIGGTMSFFTTLIHSLLENGHTVDLAANIALRDVRHCYRDWGCKVYPLSCTRLPRDKANLRVIKEIRKIVLEGNYDIVHCHTPIAAMCTRIACRKLRKSGLKVFYTAHGFHFYKGAPIKNWFLYYPAEWICSFWTDVIITINKEDYLLAKKHMHAGQVEYVPGVGINLRRFAPNRLSQEERDKLREAIGVRKEEIMLFSVGEVNKNKNQEIVIRAIAKLHNSKIHYVIAGKGNLHEYLLDVAKKLCVDAQLHLLGFRADVAALYQCADIFIFPSIREGLGLAAIEAMASGLPLIVAENRGSHEYAQDGENAFVCHHNDIDEFVDAIDKLSKNASLRKSMGDENIKRAEKFSVDIVNAKMMQIYNHSQGG